MTRANSSGLPKPAERLLARLAAVPPGGKAVAIIDAAADEACVDTLIHADLAVRRPDGALAITPVGAAHLARLAIARSGSGIDPFLGQHLALAQGEIETAQGRASVTIDTAESPLAWLARRKGRDGQAMIAPVQFQAGERLRADFTCAQLMPRTTANWNASIARDRRANGERSFTDVVIAARQRVHHALDAVGPEFKGLLLDVCCFLKRLEDCERERNWPQRSAKVVLQLGLERLARHYGYASELRGAKRAPVRAWLADDASEMRAE